MISSKDRESVHLRRISQGCILVWKDSAAEPYNFYECKVHVVQVIWHTIASVPAYTGSWTMTWSFKFTIISKALHNPSWLPFVIRTSVSVQQGGLWSFCCISFNCDNNGPYLIYLNLNYHLFGFSKGTKTTLIHFFSVTLELVHIVMHHLSVSLQAVYYYHLLIW